MRTHTCPSLRQLPKLFGNHLPAKLLKITPPLPTLRTKILMSLFKIALQITLLKISFPWQMVHVWLFRISFNFRINCSLFLDNYFTPYPSPSLSPSEVRISLSRWVSCTPLDPPPPWYLSSQSAPALPTVSSWCLCVHFERSFYWILESLKLESRKTTTPPLCRVSSHTPSRRERVRAGKRRRINCHLSTQSCTRRSQLPVVSRQRFMFALTGATNLLYTNVIARPAWQTLLSNDLSAQSSCPKEKPTVPYTKPLTVSSTIVLTLIPNLS